MLGLASVAVSLVPAVTLRAAYLSLDRATVTAAPDEPLDPDVYNDYARTRPLLVSPRASVFWAPYQDQLAEFTREELQVIGTTVAGSFSVTLDYAVSTTAIDTTIETYEVIGDDFAPGTICNASSGTTLTILTAAKVSNGDSIIRLRRLGRWKGLEVALAGTHYAGTT